MEITRTLISNLILRACLFLTGSISGYFAVAQTTTPTPSGSTTAMEIVGSPGGVSAYDAGTAAAGTTAATPPTIYGGYTGATGECAASATLLNSATCNSCDGSGRVTCNQTSIHPDLYLTVTLRSSTASSFTGTPRVRWKFSGELAGHAIDNTAAPSLVAGTPFTVQIKWSNLCSYAGGNSSCTADIDASKTLSIGIDTNNDDATIEEKVDFNFIFRYLQPASSTNTLTACPVGTPGLVNQGICDYTVAAGDEKVVITDYATADNSLKTPNTSVTYNRIIMFYQKGVGNASTVTNKSDYLILNLINNSPAEPSISDQRITGLENDVKYCFALGNMDQTGIISYFPPDSVLTNSAQVCATPSQVVGLLDDKHCFIATATYGSDMAPEVQTFRKFRNEFLLKNFVGRYLVKFYYKFGPEAAEWISSSEILKAVSLGILWPLLMFVKLSLFLGMIPAIIVGLISILLLKRAFPLLFQGFKALKGDA
ncbi:MAG TPA: CFI-box-CTERM domain-containing protein [Pseudobdellovibrionaceae bacterium]